MASLVAQTVKHLPAMWETGVQFLGQEDPLEKEMVIHSSTLAWKIPWTEEPDRLQSMGSQRVGHDWATSLSLSSRGSLVLLFLPWGWCNLNIWGYWYFSRQSWFQLTCASSSLAFRMMYSAYKLNKQGDNIQPWCTPFPIWNQSVVPCPVLLLPDWHTGFSRDRSGGLVFPSLSEFSTVCFDPHSQRLWRSQ